MVKQAIAVIIFAFLFVIAASISTVGYFTFGFSMREAVMLGAAVLAGLFALQIFMMLNRRLQDLEDDLEVAARRLTALEDEMASLSSHVDASDEGLRNQFSEQADEIKTDIAALTGIARKLAERTARLESTIQHPHAHKDQLADQPQMPTPAPSNGNVQRQQMAQQPTTQAGSIYETPPEAQAVVPTVLGLNDPLGAAPEALARVPEPQVETANKLITAAEEYLAARDASSPEDREYMQALMRNALQSNELEVYLQPAMALPQRKAESYEMLVRFREPAGTMVSASECLPFASEAGLLSDIDLKMLQRAIVVGERLRERQSTTSLFLNMSGDLLADGKRFPKAFNILESHKHLNTALVLEIAQSDFNSFGPLEHEGLSAIAELGYQFCLDFTLDRNLNLQSLLDSGFLFVKMPAGVLTSNDDISKLDIHPEDLAAHMRRQGLTLIATDIEAENQVMSVIDYGVRNAQGHLFAPAKPVRADLLRSDTSNTSKSGPASLARRRA